MVLRSFFRSFGFLFICSSGFSLLYQLGRKTAEQLFADQSTHHFSFLSKVFFIIFNSFSVFISYVFANYSWVKWERIIRCKLGTACSHSGTAALPKFEHKHTHCQILNTLTPRLEKKTNRGYGEGGREMERVRERSSSPLFYWDHLYPTFELLLRAS